MNKMQGFFAPAAAVCCFVALILFCLKQGYIMGVVCAIILGTQAFVCGVRHQKRRQQRN